MNFNSPKIMNLKVYRYKVNCLKKTYGHQNSVELNERMLKLCRSVYDECKETMKDWELEIMISEYQRYLKTNGAPREIDDVLNEREKVCRQLAKRSFRKYGKRWADSLYLRAYHNSRRRASLKDYDTAIAVYERLQNLYNVDVKMKLAACLRHAAMCCNNRNLHSKVIRYHDKQLAILLALKKPDEEVLFNIGCAYKDEGEAYLALGQYEKSVECFTRAREIFVKSEKMYGDDVDRFFFNGVFIDAIDSFLDEIERKSRGASGKKT